MELILGSGFVDTVVDLESLSADLSPTPPARIPCVLDRQHHGHGGACQGEPEKRVSFSLRSPETSQSDLQ